MPCWKPCRHSSPTSSAKNAEEQDCGRRGWSQRSGGRFDAGIGSYALVELIRRSQPQRDIIYFADRASFPYGAKSRDQLLSIMRSTIQYLTSLGAQTIVLASNAPSIMVLDTLKSEFAVPVYGVAPPVRTALATSHSGKVAVMGVRSMIESEELADFVRTQTDNPVMSL